jgi:hypothetical protein
MTKERIMTDTDRPDAMQRMGVKISRDPATGEPLAGLFLLRSGEAEPAVPNLILSAGDVRRLMTLLAETLAALEPGETAGRLQ